MIIYGVDAGEKIDKFSMVTMKMTGNYKAPIPNDVHYELVQAKTITPTNQLGIIDSIISDDMVGIYVGEGHG